MKTINIRFEVRRDDIVCCTPVAWFPTLEDAEAYFRDEAYYGRIPGNIRRATTFRYIVQDIIDDLEWFATEYYIS